MYKIFGILLLGIVLQSCLFRQQASLVVYNARIYTVDKNFTIAEAMAIDDGRVVELGTTDDILKKYNGAKEVDAKQQFIFPGLIDAHCHFSGFATDKWKCTVTGTTSWQQIVDSVYRYSLNAPMEWIYGRGWDQNDWEVKEFPEKSKLDSLFPNRPVYLKRVDGHAAIANSKALEIAGITADTKIPGGEVEVKNGKLTGMLIDNAMVLVEKKVPEIADSLALKYYNQLAEECYSYGLTSLHDCGVSQHTVSLLEKAKDNGLAMKLFLLLSDDSTSYDKWMKSGKYKKPGFTVGGYKVYADGALGSRGACLIHSYTDKPGWNGFLLSDRSHFQKLAERLSATDLQMCTHAIGDSGNRTMLEVYASVLKTNNDKRWRIEHAQVMDSADFIYFKNYNIVPSVQPTHATSDMYWAEDRLGPRRIKYAYSYKQLLEQNGYIALGTDFPVEDINPFKTFLAATARTDAKMYPAGGWQMENALSREETIRGMTIWAARSVFEEKEKGSLEPGKYADFIIINQDLMTVPFDKILDTKVSATYINGVKVYGK